MKNLIIGICGATCSGKSTVCRFIGANFDTKDLCVISQDRYYKGGDSTTNYDVPQSINFDELIADVKKLKEGVTVNVPNYDFATHSRTKDTNEIVPTKIIIVEGILIFHVEELRKLFDFRVFIDARPELRVLRRMKRDVCERGRTEEQVKLQYERDVIPSTAIYVTPHQDDADIVLKNNFDGRFIGLEVLVVYIKSRLVE